MLYRNKIIFAAFKLHPKVSFLAVILCLSFSTVFSQQARYITGKVSDAETGEPVPYATVSVKLPNGTRKGTSTDFDGLYHLLVPAKITTDSIYATYIGYKAGQKALPAAPRAEVNFQLAANNKVLKTVNVTPKTYVNPAWEIMANIVKHKPDNNLEKLKSYQFESYNRIELAATNLSDKMKQRKVMQHILPLMDSLKKFAGDDGTLSLPLFMSESVSDLYYQNSPKRKSEHVLRTKAIGVGIEDESIVSQLANSTFFQYNFYNNYLKLAGKEFISPLSDSWKLLYDYELLDTHEKINGIEYYKISFKPKREHDLSFSGIMWITEDSYALYRIDAEVSRDANLNFISRVHLQQEMARPANTTAWIPKKTRIVVYVNNLFKDVSGFTCKFYLSNKNIEVNNTLGDDVFKESLMMSDDVNKVDDKYWNAHRQDSLTVSDKKVYAMIDTVKNMPLVRTYVDVAGMLINGYYKIGKVSLGPYPYTYSYNDLQGSTFRFGGITNAKFSNKLMLGAYVSYGTKDKKIKYNGSIDYIFSRKPWVKAGVSFTHDLGQIGYQFENYIIANNNIFDATIRNGNISQRGPFEESITKAYITNDIFPNVKETYSVKHSTFNPLFLFNYSDANAKFLQQYQTTELGTELVWTPGRRLLQSSKVNRRVTINNGGDNPIITFRYTRGVKTLLGDFDYNKFGMNVTQKISMGIFGKGDYSFTAGFTPSEIPYPLLENHRYNFNTMRFLEFTSDRYVQLNYTQHMEGLITNSLPLLNRLNLRTVLDLNVLDGSLMSQNNPLNNQDYNRAGIKKVDLNLNGKPYVETGYGFENIFKIGRIDFLYRLTHLDHKDDTGVLPQRFAVRVTLQFRL